MRFRDGKRSASVIAVRARWSLKADTYPSERIMGQCLEERGARDQENTYKNTAKLPVTKEWARVKAGL